MENRLTVGFTHGDVNGIGYELIIKMMAENRICEVCTPVLFGSSKVAAYHRKALNIENFSLNSIQNARDANPKRCKGQSDGNTGAYRGMHRGRGPFPRRVYSRRGKDTAVRQL